MFKAKYIDDILPMAIWPWICQDERIFLVLSLIEVNINNIKELLTYHRLWHQSLWKTQRESWKEHWINKQKIYSFLQERFPEKDLSYIINYNYDRYINRYPKYWLQSLRTYMLILLKYPRAFFLLSKCLLYKLVIKLL